MLTCISVVLSADQPKPSRRRVAAVDSLVVSRPVQLLDEQQAPQQQQSKAIVADQYARQPANFQRLTGISVEVFWLLYKLARPLAHLYPIQANIASLSSHEQQQPLHLSDQLMAYLVQVHMSLSIADDEELQLLSALAFRVSTSKLKEYSNRIQAMLSDLLANAKARQIVSIELQALIGHLTTAYVQLSTTSTPIDDDGHKGSNGTKTIVAVEEI